MSLSTVHKDDNGQSPESARSQRPSLSPTKFANAIILCTPQTWEHLSPLYEQRLPIVELTLDAHWDPHVHVDDNGEMVMAPLANMIMVIQWSVVQSRKDKIGMNMRVTFDLYLDPAVALHQENQNSQEIFCESSKETERRIFSKAFHLGIRHHRQRQEEYSTIRFLPPHSTDEFLNASSCIELFGILREDLRQDSWIFGTLGANVLPFCM
jgi:hypothetical protein